MVMKKSGRGSVGRAFKRKEKRQEEEFKRKQLEYIKRWYKRNKDKILRQKKEYNKKITPELNEIANKRCKTCDKLLHYRTKGDYCHKHFWIGRKKKLKNGDEKIR